MLVLQDGPGAWIGERWRPDVEVVPRLPLVDVEPSARRCLVWHFYDVACDMHVRHRRGGPCVPAPAGTSALRSDGMGA